MDESKHNLVDLDRFKDMQGNPRGWGQIEAILSQEFNWFNNNKASSKGFWIGWECFGIIGTVSPNLGSVWPY